MKVYWKDDYESAVIANKIYDVGRDGFLRGEDGVRHGITVVGYGCLIPLVEYIEYTGPVPAGFILWDGGRDGPALPDTSYHCDVEVIFAIGGYDPVIADPTSCMWENVIAYRIVEDKQMDVPSLTEGKEVKVAIPKFLADIAIAQMKIDLDEIIKGLQYGDGIDLAMKLREKGYAIDDSHVTDLSEYLQSIAD